MLKRCLKQRPERKDTDEVWTLARMSNINGSTQCGIKLAYPAQAQVELLAAYRAGAGARRRKRSNAGRGRWSSLERSSRDARTIVFIAETGLSERSLDPQLGADGPRCPDIHLKGIARNHCGNGFRFPVSSAYLPLIAVDHQSCRYRVNLSRS